MTGLLEMVSRLEETGTRLVLDGDRIRYFAPSGNSEVQVLLAELRKHRSEVVSFLRARNAPPTMPPGIHLVEWNLKEPPVAIETCAIVSDPAKFAKATLGELCERLTNPGRKCGWSVPQLIDRLLRLELGRLSKPLAGNLIWAGPFKVSRQIKRSLN